MTIRLFSIKVHRFLGAVLSLLFVLWFLSAFVLIYWHYPKYKPSERATHSPILSKSSLPKDSTLIHLQEKFQDSHPNQPIKSLSLQSDLRMGEHYQVKTSESSYYYNLNFQEIAKATAIDALYLSRVANLWHKKVLSIDTIQSLDQWTPFSRLRKDLPFYRLNLSGDDAQQVYISSRNGNIITEHRRSERIGAYFGAIPHWVYFTAIRQNTDLWIWIILILSGFGIFMVLTGIYVGIDMMRLARSKKKKPELSPYRKKTYRWHHIMGTLFGLFILSWIFSGFMSVVDIPDWMAGKEDLRGKALYKDKALEEDNFKLEGIEDLYAQFPKGIRIISWANTLEKRTISITDAKGKEHLYLCEADKYELFSLKEKEVNSLIEKTYPQTAYSLSRISEYDGYYHFTPNQEGDFAWKAEIETDASPVVYINNSTGHLRIVNHRSRLNQWLYKKPHTLQFAVLERYPWLWTVVMWTLLIIGLFVSVTGLLMSIPYFKRSFKKKKKK